MTRERRSTIDYGEVLGCGARRVSRRGRSRRAGATDGRFHAAADGEGGFVPPAVAGRQIDPFNRRLTRVNRGTIMALSGAGWRAIPALHGARTSPPAG